LFGLFKKKTTEKVVLDLEVAMVCMEKAALKNDLGLLWSFGRKQLRHLQWLHSHGEWSEDEVMAYLQKRGNVRSLEGETLTRLMQDRMMQAELKHGLLAS
jgi:uncharacterized protein (DUF2252 family)